jgi:hypothetical protein
VRRCWPIADAVDALPSFVAAADRVGAEAHLLNEAATHDAAKLKVLGRHLLTVIDPEVRTRSSPQGRGGGGGCGPQDDVEVA